VLDIGGFFLAAYFDCEDCCPEDWEAPYLKYRRNLNKLDGVPCTGNSRLQGCGRGWREGWTAS